MVTTLTRQNMQHKKHGHKHKSMKKKTEQTNTYIHIKEE